MELVEHKIMTRVVTAPCCFWSCCLRHHHHFGKFQKLKFFFQVFPSPAVTFDIWAEGTDVTNVNISYFPMYENMTVNIDAWVDHVVI